jgi:hypothetical protein
MFIYRRQVASQILTLRPEKYRAEMRSGSLLKCEKILTQPRRVLVKFRPIVYEEYLKCRQESF